MERPLTALQREEKIAEDFSSMERPHTALHQAEKIADEASSSNVDTAGHFADLSFCHIEARVSAMGTTDGCDDGEHSVSGLASTYGGASAATLR